MRTVVVAGLLLLAAGCSSSGNSGTSSGGATAGATTGSTGSTGSAGGSSGGTGCAAVCGPNQVCVAGSCVAASGTSGGSGGSTTSGSSHASTSSGAASTGSSSSGSASSSSGSSGSSSGSSTSSGSSGANLCAGNPIFCDDFTNPSLAADYTLTLGTWTRNTGSLSVTDSTAWDRPRATLGGVPSLATGVSDFDITFAGTTNGDPGFGFFWASVSADDGYAVLVHPGTYQGIYLKQLVPGQNDVNLASVALPAGLAGTPMTVRILRVASQVTVWLNGTQMLSASDGAGNVTGLFGLMMSNTGTTTPADGAAWTLFRVDQAGSYETLPDGGATDGGAEDGGSPDAGYVLYDGGCTSGPPSGTTPQPVGVAGNWTLVFDDEFDGNSIDATRWGVFNGGCNNDVTCSPSNVAVANGCMALTLASSNSGAEVCSDASCGAGSNAYDLPVGGYAEARISFPGNGTTIYNWPAWWASGPNWPAAGEEDIAEGLGTLTANYHSPNGAQNSGTISGTWSNAFHVYGMWRQATQALYYWDGNLVQTWNTSDNGQPQTLLVNVGCSGSCVAGAASQVYVDYVRAWQ